jgi:hypothetical protein
MGDAFWTLLGNAFDFAGMFPPASLPLAEAMSIYRSYGACDAVRGRMALCFLCPSISLPQLTDLAAKPEPFTFAGPVSVVIPPMASVEDLLQSLQDAVTLSEAYPRSQEIVAFECRVPDNATIDTFVPAAGKVTSKSLYFEIPPSADRDSWRNLASVVAAFNQDSSWSHDLALKIRTGGTTASAVPSTEKLAAFIVTCRDADVRWKATAGLHHPIRCRDEHLGVTVHGFVNLFVAAALGHQLRLEESAVQRILEETDPRNFHFAEESVSWREFSISANQAAAARAETIWSFGTCSIEEPLQHLRELGWL